MTLLLPGSFNPTLRSLSRLKYASVTPGTRECLNVDRACRSTISDAHACLDPQLLQPLIAELRSKVPELAHTDRQLDQLLPRAVAVDASLFSAAGEVAWALRRRKPGGDEGETTTRSASTSNTAAPPG